MRIKPAEKPYSSLVQRRLDAIMPPGVEPLALFTTVARNERVFDRLMSGGLLDKGTLTIRQREIMILRTCALCGCTYEWGVHAAFHGPKAKFTEAQITDTASANIDGALWHDEDRLILALAEALHRSADCPDELWSQLTGVFTNEQIIELIALAGYYHSIAYLCNALRLPSESFARPFPG